ncbi:MAG: hypothetical protein ACR2L9_04635 [Solirubrobacteraceae bacterium]
MTGFEQLERELLAAERRLASAAPTSRRLRTGWWRRSAGRAATVMAVIVALVIAAGAIIVAGHRAPSDHAAHPAPAAVQRLVDELGVLRSPQTAAARRWLHGEDFRRLTHTPGGRFGLIPSTARALSLPDHERLILYVVGSSRLGLTGLGLMERGRSSGFGECCITDRELRRPAGPGPLSYQSGRIPPQVYFEIVPDGVSKVRWTFARRGNFGYARVPRRSARRRRRASPGFIGAPFSAPLTVTVAVRDNVAAIKLPNRGAAISDTWFDAAGGVIARHGKH